MRRFQHKFYNLFTCNCHSFVANCLNRVAYNGSVEWNVLNVAALVWFHGRWVDKMSVVRSFLPFLTVTCIGILMAGWPFLVGMAAFSALLIGWFIFTVCCFKGLVCWLIYIELFDWTRKEFLKEHWNYYHVHPFEIFWKKACTQCFRFCFLILSLIDSRSHASSSTNFAFLR